MAAEDYIRMHTAAIQYHQTTTPFEQDTVKTLLVVGGGITGMTSALVL